MLEYDVDELFNSWDTEFYLTDDGNTLTKNEYSEYLYNKQIEQESQQTTLSWQTFDTNTINTQLIQYKELIKQNKSQQANQLFNEIWETKLSNVIKMLTYKYFIKKLPERARYIFLNGYNYSDIQDELYELLIITIDKWKYDMQDKNTRNFVSYLDVAIKNYWGNILNEFNCKVYQNLKP
jgi:hypothetical protein